MGTNHRGVPDLTISLAVERIRKLAKRKSGDRETMEPLYNELSCFVHSRLTDGAGTTPPSFRRGGRDVHSPPSKIKHRQCAGSEIGAQRKLFGRSSIYGFDLREAMEIEIQRAARLSSWAVLR